jgi:chaperonin GroEL
MTMVRQRLVQQNKTCISAPTSLALLSQGVMTFSTPMAQTLGPTCRFVVNERTRGEYEQLTDACTIARRMIRLPGRGHNLGAMLLRQMVLELHERFGDGVATAAVMVRAMVQEGTRIIAAGTNPVLLTQGMKRGVAAAVSALNAQARPVRHLDELVALASGVAGDLQLGMILGQMFDTMGEHATVMIQDTANPGLDYEYIKGGKWDGYIPSWFLFPENKAGLVLHHPLIVLADEDLTTVEQVQPVMELAMKADGKPPLLILAREISGDALNMLVTNHTRGTLTTGLFILSSGRTLMHQDLEDIATLTGGQVLSSVNGYTTRMMQDRLFGRARRVVLMKNGITIADGAGSQKAVRERIGEVRNALRTVSRAEDSDWQYMRMRLARLAGGIGVLKLGAHTEQEHDRKKEQVNKALRALEAAYEGGLIPGGGAALLACIPTLRQARMSSQNEDEVMGISIVETALKAPFLQIVTNYGIVQPSLALETVLKAGAGYGFDALNGDYARMEDRHILDSLSIIRGALEAATSSAAMMMTIDRIVFTA